MKHDCETHMWSKTLHEPPELEALGFTRCPLCIMSKRVDSNFVLAAECPELPGCSWVDAEAANTHYADACEEHRARLSPDDQREFDRRTVKRWFASLPRP